MATSSGMSLLSQGSENGQSHLQMLDAYKAKVLIRDTISIEQAQPITRNVANANATP